MQRSPLEFELSENDLHFKKSKCQAHFTCGPSKEEAKHRQPCFFQADWNSMGEMSSWPNRVTFFRLMLHPSDWTKAVVNAKKIPASPTGIFPPSLWPSLREAKIQEFNTRSLLSLGIPDATNRHAEVWIVAEAAGTLVVVVQDPVPCIGAIGRGAPPVADVPSAREASREGADAARQT